MRRKNNVRSVGDAVETVTGCFCFFDDQLDPLLFEEFSRRRGNAHTAVIAGANDNDRRLKSEDILEIFDVELVTSLAPPGRINFPPAGDDVGTVWFAVDDDFAEGIGIDFHIKT